MPENSLVLLSGGLDSAVALYWALLRGWSIHTIEFEYFQRPERERQACRDLRAASGITGSLVVQAGFLREVGDVPGGMVANMALGQAPDGYIPARNLVFYSICAHYAEILNARYIVGGHNRTDSESFPDAGREFFRNLDRLLRLGLWSYSATCTEIVLPLIELDKIEVVRLGLDLHVPFELTWSCYHDDRLPCGTCESCTERRQAFAANAMPDPSLLRK